MANTDVKSINGYNIKDEPARTNINDLDDRVTELENMDITKSVSYTNSMPIAKTMGGINVGETFDNVPITKMLDKLLYPYIAPSSISAVINSPVSSGTFECGVVKTVTKITVSFTKGSTDITKVELYKGSTLITQITDAPTLLTINTTSKYIFNISVDVSTDSSFVVKITDEKTTYSASTGSYKFVYPYYYGVFNDGVEINSTNIVTLTKLIQSKANTTKAFTTTNQRIIFASPTNKITKITDANTFNVTDTFTETSINVVGLDGTTKIYYVYSSGLNTVSSFNMTFTH